MLISFCSAVILHLYSIKSNTRACVCVHVRVFLGLRGFVWSLKFECFRCVYLFKVDNVEISICCGREEHRHAPAKQFRRADQRERRMCHSHVVAVITMNNEHQRTKHTNTQRSNVLESTAYPRKIQNVPFLWLVDNQP